MSFIAFDAERDDLVLPYAVDPVSAPKRTIHSVIDAALRAIGALASGETAEGDMADDALEFVNDMLDQWSNQHLLIPYQTEIVFPLATNQTQYTIGLGGTINAQFVGAIDGNTLTVASMVRGHISLGQVITGVGVRQTRIVSFGTGSGGFVNAPGTYTVDVVQNAYETTMTGYYERPLRFGNSFVRVATLDYPVYPLSNDQYQQIGLKHLNGAWPIAFYYQPSEALGNLFFFPSPSTGEMHLFADTVLQRFYSIDSPIVLPQGYAMAIRWNLAANMMPEYGRNDQELGQMIVSNAKSSKAWLKRTNKGPQTPVRFDSALAQRGQMVSAGWILSSGYGP